MQQSPEPTPEEIRRECERIQSEWTERDKRSRRAWSCTAPVETPIIHSTVSMSADNDL